MAENTLLVRDVFESWFGQLLQNAATEMDTYREVSTRIFIVALRDPQPAPDPITNRPAGDPFPIPRTIDLKLGAEDERLSRNKDFPQTRAVFIERFSKISSELARRAERAGIVLIAEMKLSDVDYVIALATHISGTRRARMASILRGATRARLSRFIDMPEDMQSAEPVSLIFKNMEFVPDVA